jgi:hypothetical protein
MFFERIYEKSQTQASYIVGCQVEKNNAKQLVAADE